MTSDDLSPTAADGPAGPELDQVRHAFLTARGDQDDPRWAETALVALVFADVRIDAAEACLIGAAGLVQQSQESPRAAVRAGPGMGGRAGGVPAR